MSFSPKNVTVPREFGKPVYKQAIVPVITNVNGWLHTSTFVLFIDAVDPVTTSF